jgi:hemolysin III
MSGTGPAPAKAGPAQAGVFFDARRGVYYARPMLRGWLHTAWFGASVVAGPLLLAGAHGPKTITAGAIYATSVSALFGVSALYHRGNWSGPARQRMQRLDHMMIIFLIAGTATPVLLLASPGAFGLACLSLVWALAVTAAAARLRWMSAPELVAGAIFVGLGWAAGLALPDVWIHAGAASAALLLAGGLLYTARAVCYRRRRPDPYPSVLGYHEVFHAFGCIAAACQYAAIARLAG